MCAVNLSDLSSSERLALRLVYELEEPITNDELAQFDEGLGGLFNLGLAEYSDEDGILLTQEGDRLAMELYD